MAENEESVNVLNEQENEENVIGTDADEPSGFITEALNKSIEKALDNDKEYGRTVSKFASAPKFGGYVIGTYKYNSGAETNEFNCRLVRLYVDGTILNDFKYRLQLQMNGSKPHVKDFFIDWVHWKEFGVKIGQYKRCFTFENPYNPWNVGVGDYSQLVKKFAGMGDIVGEDSGNGGRDQGIQVHGDLFPISSDKHRLVHYELGLYNGQGINTGDKNNHKDFIGTIQFQPIKDLYIGGFYWNGSYINANGVSLERNRFCVGAKYETTEWSARMEYARDNCKEDALYATVGIPCTPWLKTYIKYDHYRKNGSEGDMLSKDIYSVCPNFQLHKNLMFQLQYNYNDNRLTDNKYSDLWLETYVRF